MREYLVYLILGFITGILSLITGFLLVFSQFYCEWRVMWYVITGLYVIVSIMAILIKRKKHVGTKGNG